MKQKKVKIVIGIIVLLGIIVSIFYYIMTTKDVGNWNGKGVRESGVKVEATNDETGFHPAITDPGPTIEILTEFPTGIVNEKLVEVEYEAIPSAGAMIVEVRYTINGEDTEYMYLSNAEEKDKRSILGKGRLFLLSGENHIVITVEDSRGKTTDYEVKERPILELVDKFPESNPEKIVPSERYEDWYYVKNWIVVITPRDKEVSKEEVIEAVKLVDGVRIGGYERTHYIEVPDSTEDELDAMCELLMAEYEELFMAAIMDSFPRTSFHGNTQGTIHPTNDTWWGNEEWGLTVIQAPEAWMYGAFDQIRVGVVDEGFLYYHEELAIPQENVVQSQPYNHGTHVMGTVGAKHGGGKVSGVVEVPREISQGRIPLAMKL